MDTDKSPEIELLMLPPAVKVRSAPILKTASCGVVIVRVRLVPSTVLYGSVAVAVLMLFYFLWALRTP